MDPTQTVDVYLPGDDRPEHWRPAFVYRYFTAREDLERSQLAAAAGEKGNTPQQYHAHLAKLIGVGLVGWRNLTDPDGNPVPFEKGKPEEAFRALTDLELWEVATEATRRTELSELEKKRSRSSSTTAPANSAPAAPEPAAA